MLPFVLHAALTAAGGTAPGRSDRMFSKRAPRDLGMWEPDCKGREAACNNACFYIRCMARNTPDANKITYVGTNQDREKEKNRHESGCRVDNPQSTSVCGAFPFSQKFSDKLARDWDCDEWPPASAMQDPFNTPGRIPNSLRCMTFTENRSLGGSLSAFLLSKNAARDDFYRVDLTKKISSADQSKVKYCLPQLDCGQDGRQFQLSVKPSVGGKIDSPYDGANGRDNRYKLSNVAYGELYQCSVKFTRTGDADITDAKVSSFDDTETVVANFQLPKDGATYNMRGLPVDLQVKRTGAFGTKLEFSYAPGVPGTNVNNFDWDSEMEGSGRGPFTNGGQPRRFCKVEAGSTPNTQLFNCWFPCYQTANGR